jgi:hypothetical protein
VSFDPGYLFASLFVSSVGFVLFRYGKKQRRPPHTIVGIISMVFPYAVDSVPVMLAIGACLWALLYLATRFGL